MIIPAVLGLAITVLVIIPQGSQIHTYLDNSAPYIGIDAPRHDGIDGAGITVAVIDTGVDFGHPDLFGWGKDGKVTGGYNFVQNDMPPLDASGHGTQVAGIIAADGKISGIAPKAKILAYKVSEDGEEVSSEYIVRAIEMAVEDGADIINISLGVNKTNPAIERAVNHALDSGVFVVAAAGNDGPEPGTIGSPGRNKNALTVGATYNNLTSSLIATLSVDDKPYTVIPMVGTPKTDVPLTGRIVDGGFGRQDELAKIDARDSILIVQRGSYEKDELLYFSIKENNAASAGARALIVYNNIPGIFLGELVHEFAPPDYTPRIPVVSIDRDEGLEITKLANSSATLHMLYNPDVVTHFSSRGPVSQFYIKPEIIAPGAYINTTQNNSTYGFTSGTSYAAPHVSGAVALLMQKNPGLENDQIRSILLTTAVPVFDAYGQGFAASDAGAGRINITSAFDARLVITPPSFVATTSSYSPTTQVALKLLPLQGGLQEMTVAHSGQGFKVTHGIDGGVLTAGITGEAFGQHEGGLIISYDGVRHTVPFLLHHTQGAITARQQDDMLYFEINHPEKWNFAKISVTDSMDGKTTTTSATPSKQGATRVTENSTYWIEARIRAGQNTSSAFDTITTSGIKAAGAGVEIPHRQILVISLVVAAACAAGALKNRLGPRPGRYDVS